MKTLAVTGSREYAHPAVVYRVVSEYASLPEYGLMIHGGAEGPDTWANDAAEGVHCPVLVLRPEYHKFRTRPKVAPLARNTEIAKRCDTLLAFWDEKSNGTLDTIRKALKAGKTVHLWGADGRPRSTEGLNK